MKGVILAGGKGTRLYPLTAVTNKHLAPVGCIPMIEYPLYTLTSLGIKDISVVTGGEHFADIARYLAELHPGINFSYHPQAEAGGIAQALGLVKPFVGKEKLAVILGDNIFKDNFCTEAEKFENSETGSMFFLKRVSNPERFGVAETEGDKIINIDEKPKNPKTDLAVTGLYFYDSSVFDKISILKPSGRGEYEITDANNSYIQERNVGFKIVDGFWSDAGTVESKETCDTFVRVSGLEREILLSLSSNEKVAASLRDSFGKKYSDIFKE
jgi:glucose-1-phosphate thymidylyltransferase